MENTAKNILFLLNQIGEFLDRFPIGVINKDISVYHDVNEILKFYIELLQDCIYEDKKEDSNAV